MVMPFLDSVAGTAVYLNPDFVVTVRPDPAALAIASAASSYAMTRPFVCKATAGKWPTN